MAHRWAENLERGAWTAAQLAGAAHAAYQVGKAVYGIGSAIAPYAAMLI